MTQLLVQAIEKVHHLPLSEQNAIATIILDEERWSAAFAKSQDQLANLAERARQDIKAGDFREMPSDAIRQPDAVRSGRGESSSGGTLSTGSGRCDFCHGLLAGPSEVPDALGAPPPRTKSRRTIPQTTTAGCPSGLSGRADSDTP